MMVLLQELSRVRKNSVVYLAAVVAALYLVALFAVPVATAAYAASPAASTTPKLLLRPLNSSPGKSVKVTGLHFTDSSTATVTFNSVTVATGVAINSTGGFVTSFTVPSDTAAGSYTVTAKDGSGLTASNTLTIAIKAKLTLTTSGSSRIVGTTVTVQGTGFDSKAPITVSFNGVTVTSTTSNSTGGFEAVFQVPQVPAGSATVSATDGTNTASRSMTIKSHLTSSSSTTAPGDTITVTGTGFAASSSVSFTLDGNALSTTTTTNSTGTFVASITIPTTASKGGQPLVATDGSGNSATVRLRVT